MALLLKHCGSPANMLLKKHWIFKISLHFQANLFDMYQLQMIFVKTRWEGGDDGFHSKQMWIMGTHFSIYHIMTLLHLSLKYFWPNYVQSRPHMTNEEQFESVINTCLSQYKLSVYMCKSDLTSKKCTFRPQIVCACVFLIFLTYSSEFFL